MALPDAADAAVVIAVAASPYTGGYRSVASVTNGVVTGRAHRRISYTASQAVVTRRMTVEVVPDIADDAGSGDGRNMTVGTSASRTAHIGGVAHMVIVIVIVNYIRITVPVAVSVGPVVSAAIVGVVGITVVVIIESVPTVAPRIPIVPEGIIVVGVVGRAVVIGDYGIRRIIMQIPTRTVPIPRIVPMNINVNVTVVVIGIGPAGRNQFVGVGSEVIGLIAVVVVVVVIIDVVFVG